MKTIKQQIYDAIELKKKHHTEDCLNANDDTSVLKGKCICPKKLGEGSHIHARQGGRKIVSN
jgi:hypothetical protein